MSLYMNRLRPRLKALLSSLGLLSDVQRFRSLIQLLAQPDFRRQRVEGWRRERAHRQRFLQFKRQYAGVLGHRLNRAGHGQKSALVASIGVPEVEAELGLVKGLELAGFTPTVLVPHQDRLVPLYYGLASIKEVRFLSDIAAPLDYAAAEAAIEPCRSMQDLVAIKYAGARVGRLAAMTALRRQRLASLDLGSTQDRRMIVNYVASSMAAAAAAQEVLQQTRPDLALVVDGVYTPEGELFETCLNNGIDVVLWNSAHKSNTLMLKRYTVENIDQPPPSLSSRSWRLLRDIEWTDSRREQLQRELYDSYASGDWYSSAGTQFGKRFMGGEEVRRLLGLDPEKKTAFVFPHIFWDASLTAGSDLFPSYQEWFIETVRAACANDQVNWVIKIHPAHVGKSIVEGYRGEPAEARVLRRYIGQLPSHIFVMPADSDICTFSLFELMDYCVTVRGTIGIEAASFGIPVLTAGTGRYDHKGFTIDSASRQRYLERLGHIQTIPRLSSAQRELAERFAYGLFVLRPFPITTVTLEFPKDKQKDEGGNSTTRVNITDKEKWYTAPDLRAFARWVADSGQADFLMPLGQAWDQVVV